MSDRREKNEIKRIRLPDGSYGIYMGETGKGAGRKPMRRPDPRRGQKHSASQKTAEINNGVRKHNVRHAQEAEKESAPRRRALQGGQNRERALRAAENKRRAEKENRSFIGKFFHFAADKIYMRRMGVSVDVDNIICGVIVGAMVFIFAMLQTTVFARFRPFGAVPDLMLPLVIAVSVTEGEKWGSVTGLAAALFIESIGTTGVSLLPLLYVPCGFVVGILSSSHYRDSVAIRIIYSAAAGLLRAVFTAIYAACTYKSPSAALVVTSIIIPEYFSTFVMSVIPHFAAWLALKPFHKSRAERVD